MKIFRYTCLLLAVLFLLGGFPLPVWAETLPEETTNQTEPPVVPPYTEGLGDSSVTSGCHSINAQVPLWGSERLLESAGAAMLYELNSDTMVYAWNPDQQVPPASLVKIMTCLLAIENVELSKKITVTSTALATLPKGITPSLAEGEEWTMEQLLCCLMVGGYNDAAVVIAEHVAGSQRAFVRMMNERAKEIGCVATVFTNATGLHDDNQLSTTRDLVRILAEAVKNESFRYFFSQTVFRLPATEYHEARYMETPNYMMTSTITQEYYDARVTGGRTGVTESRERCLIVTAESKGLHYIAIVMCAKATYDDEGDIVRFGSYEEVKQLISKGFANHRVTQILSDEQILTQYPVASGENSVAVGPSATVFSVLPSDILSSELSYRYQQIPTLQAPVSAGEYVTAVQVWYGNVCIAQSSIITRNSSDIATRTNQSEAIEQTGEGLRIFLRLLAILGVILLVIGLLFVTARLARLARIRAQHRRRRRNRRRSR